MLASLTPGAGPAASASPAATARTAIASSGSTASATASAPASQAVQTATPSTARTFPDAQEALLLARIPAVTRGSCQRGELDAAESEGAAVVECRPTGHLAPSTVTYAMYGSEASVDDAYIARLGDVPGDVSLRNVATLCTMQPHSGGYGDFTYGSAPGKLMCYSDPAGPAVFIWGVRALRVMVEAVRDDGNSQQLYEWWSQPDRSGPLG
jgi:hypothetical protein